MPTASSVNSTTSQFDIIHAYIWKSVFVVVSDEVIDVAEHIVYFVVDYIGFGDKLSPVQCRVWSAKFWWLWLKASHWIVIGVRFFKFWRKVRYLYFVILLLLCFRALTFLSPVKDLFWWKVPLCRCSSYFFRVLYFCSAIKLLILTWSV